MPEFNCTHCNARLSLPNAQPGQAVRCGQCRQATTVPGAAASSPTDPNGALRAYTPPVYTHTSQPPTGSAGLAIGAFVCALLGLITCIFPLGIVGLILGIIALSKSKPGRGLAIAAVVVGVLSIFTSFAILLPALGAARRTARQMQNSTQVRGIHQGLIIQAQSNNGWYAGLDNAGNIIDPAVEARFKILFDNKHFNGSYAISPAETKNAWQSGPVDSTMYSYSMLQIPKAGDRKQEWRQTSNAQAPSLSDRLIIENGSEKSLHTTPRKPNSVEWRGSIAWNDNHVSFEPDYTVDTRYVQSTNLNDNIFQPAANNDAWMVYTGNGNTPANAESPMP